MPDVLVGLAVCGNLGNLVFPRRWWREPMALLSLLSLRVLEVKKAYRMKR